MDSDTWNAYHIVSNRARSVCYATRQQHFRKRAELTVNALISTATSQLDAMKDLKVSYKDPNLVVVPLLTVHDQVMFIRVVLSHSEISHYG